MNASLPDLVARFRGARVLVLGDVMLDRFVYGHARRISPEAPVPVLTVERRDAMPGGAANVARNIASLGGQAILIGIIGEDTAGQTLSDLLASGGGIIDALVRGRARPTTEKTRFIADRQQILRADIERPHAATDDEASQLLDAYRNHLDLADVVVLSDYNKGVLCDAVLGPAIALARAAGKPIVVDPKSANIARYDGATVLTPNADEAAAATRLPVDGDAAVAACGAAMLEAAPALGAVLITRGAKGMTLAERGQPALHIPVTSQEVFDVSGAGDTAVSALTLGLAAGAPLAVAAQIANFAAGLAVRAVGTAAIGAEELIAELQAQRIHDSEAKIVSVAQAVNAVERWRARGARIGFTNGCFDLIHPGHVSLLSQARAACDRLVVGVNSDASVKRLKGESRPIQDETARAIVLASLSAVDLVVVFAQDTPEELIRAIRPDVLVKGADYTVDTVVGADFVTAHGGKVVLARLMAGQSTTNTLTRFGRAAEGRG